MFLPPPIPDANDTSEATSQDESRLAALAHLQRTPIRSTPSLSVFNGASVALFCASSDSGTALTRRLIALGPAELHVVEHVDAEVPDDIRRSERVRLHRWKTPDDIAGLKELADAKVEYVLNAAIRMTDWEHLQTYTTYNLDLPRRVLRLAEHYRTAGSLKRVAHISTTDVYGYTATPSAAVTDETTDPRDANTPAQTTACYGDLLAHHGIDRGVPLTVFRVPFVYGPGCASSTALCASIERGTATTVGGGLADPGLVYADNLAEGVLLACAEPAASGRVYNMWAREPCTWRELYDLTADALDAPRVSRDLSVWLAVLVAWLLESLLSVLNWFGVPGRPWLTAQQVNYLRHDRNFASERARIVFGWTPNVSVAEGVKRTVEAYRATKGKNGAGVDFGGGGGSGGKGNRTPETKKQN
ncbi:NAD(P)-binding protein [Gonapodya prolifera JEL478]|uniref:NAD(P)-binding protein n=1 Tax=Gonapodya prolifera (strain JEL478) TaxID=1344416 RepID=A0A139A0T8_GONPJ|nr:NAD(P)-binding protein [Gonapodya prolifera JEL478]|eukprot:KXS09973.1 NAD(P)-binding protein [Gonapodya prolifera JEL478]